MNKKTKILLPLIVAVALVLGSNIGTTVTAWLVAWLGFKADISILAVPLMLFGFLFSNSKKNQRQNIGELIVGFSLLFLGLSFMKNSVPDLRETPQVLEFVTTWASHGFGSVLLFLAFGTVLTLVLQSSSATMAITLIMLSMGWIPFHMACAMVLGENIGTTITANIAASVGNTQAKRAAMSHTIFNVFGVIWALALFTPFLKLVGLTITWMGLPNPMDIVHSADVAMTPDEEMASLYGVSMLHTLFNVFNTCILIWFVPVIVKAVTAMIKEKKGAEEDTVKLKFIDVGNHSTAELAIGQARNEVVHFAEISRRGVDFIRKAINAANDKEFEETRQRLVKYEEISDRIEYEIATFLNGVSAEEVSESTSLKIKAMYKIIGELESLGDSGETISRILSRKNIHKKRFDASAIKNLNTMADAVSAAYDVMIANLNAAHRGVLTDITDAYNAETFLNTLRNDFRDAVIEELENGDNNYQTSVYYMDIINAYERMGDFMINVSQDLERGFVLK